MQAENELEFIDAKNLEQLENCIKKANNEEKADLKIEVLKKIVINLGSGKGNDYINGHVERCKNKPKDFNMFNCL